MGIKNIIKKIVGYELREKIHKKKVYRQFKKEYKTENRRTLVERKFKEKMGYNIELDNPQTFNEKITWMKVNWYSPLAITCSDKWAVKEYLRQNGYEDIVPKTFGVWSDPKKIKFKTLPNKFILKTNHGCGDCYICRDKNELNKKQAIKELREDFYYEYSAVAQEWTYDGITPKVFCEELLEEDGRTPYDYKIICNNGKAKFLYVCKRYDCKIGNLELNYYDREFNLIPCKQHYPNITIKLEKPKNYEKMIALAEELSKPFPFVRVDFYNIDGKLYFGEFTFFPSGGALAFEPEEYDKVLGDMIELPEKQETPFNHEK